MPDWFYVLIWWLILQLFGWVAFPITHRIFRWLPDRGYTLTKSVGLLLISYLLWLGATIGFLRNDSGGILVAILLVAGISAWFYFKARNKENSPDQFSIRAFIHEHIHLVLTIEILFTVAFVAWAVLRAYAPDKIMNAGGEKFMEIAFQNAILNSPHFPPLDPWLSGFSISYYYFGYVMMALMTRLSGAPSGIGFDLYDALLFALTAIGAFGIIFNLVAGSRRAKADSRRAGGNWQAIRYGLLGSLFMVGMGNLEGLFESLYSKGVLPNSFWEWINIPGLLGSPVTGSWYPGNTPGWWWWRASRVIFDMDFSHKLIPDPPIDEFPFFSFLLGDNHPHVLALPFVLLAISLALNLLRRTLDEGRTTIGDSNVNKPSSWWNPIKASLDGDWVLFLFYALSLGALGFLNTWDLPIYLILIVLAFGVGTFMKTRRFDGDLLLQMLVLGVGLLLSAILLYLFFYVSFSSQAGGVLPYIFPPTRLPQYLVMFGPFIFIVTFFIFTYFSRQVRQGNSGSMFKSLLRWWGWVVLGCIVFLCVVLALVALVILIFPSIRQMAFQADVQKALGGLGFGQAIVASLTSRVQDPWLFILATLILAVTLTNLFGRFQIKTTPVEGEQSNPRISSSTQFAFLLILVGLGLTLSVEFFYLRDIFGYRMNTIFKFYYQGWVMMGCASAYGVWWMLNQAERVIGQIGKYVFLTGFVIWVAVSMVYPAMASYGRVQGFQSQPNLDGASGVARGNPDDWAAIVWLREHAQGREDVPVILEAPGGSYTYEGRISAFTGFPAVLGWAAHEAQWRGNYDEQGKREPDIITIFTTLDGQTTLDLLHKWGVNYVIVGAVESNYIQRLCASPNYQCNLTGVLRKFDQMLVPVFSQGETAIYEVP